MYFSSTCTYHADVNLEAAIALRFKRSCKLCKCSTNDAVGRNADRNITFTFVPAPRGTESGPRQQLTARLHANNSQDSTSPPTGPATMPDQQLASMIASIVEKKLATLNSASNSPLASFSNRSATFTRRSEPRTRSLSPRCPQWQTTTDSDLSGFLVVLLAARLESRHTGRRSLPAHQLQSPFYRQPSLQQLHRRNEGLTTPLPSQAKFPEITGIDRWLDAFAIYSSVLLSSYPSQREDLFAYQQLIRESARKFPGMT